MISYAGHANKNFYKAPLDSVYVNLLMCLYLLVQHSTGICGRDQNGIHMSDLSRAGMALHRAANSTCEFASPVVEYVYE